MEESQVSTRMTSVLQNPWSMLDGVCKTLVLRSGVHDHYRPYAQLTAWYSNSTTLFVIYLLTVGAYRSS